MSFIFGYLVERQLTRRFSATASLPVQFAWRTSRMFPAGTFHVNSIGDMTVGGRACGYSARRRRAAETLRWA